MYFQDALEPPDVKDIDTVTVHAAFELVSRLMDEMRDVDERHRIGAFDNEQSARLQPPQNLAGMQYRQWAFQASKIERLHRRNQSWNRIYQLEVEEIYG
jgi:hypothetical protein